MSQNALWKKKQQLKHTFTYDRIQWTKDKSHIRCENDTIKNKSAKRIQIQEKNTIFIIMKKKKRKLFAYIDRYE